MAMRAPAGKSLPLVAVGFILHLFCLRPVKSYVVVEGGRSYHPMGGKLEVTHLHFFLQDFVTGNNATAVKVAGPNGTRAVSPFAFGDVYVIDDPLTEGVSRNSNVVGNAQGIYAFTGIDKLSLFMAVDFGFTTGEYNGSSFSVASRNPISETTREIPVVGGRGRFRLARGFALLTTRYFRGLDAIVEYNVTVLHH